MDIKIDDIPYDLHTLVDIIGIDKFEEVSRFYGGTAVYIPIHKKVIIGKRNRQIIREYNGRNINALRLKYSLTSQQIKRILKSQNIIV